MRGRFRKDGLAVEQERRGQRRERAVLTPGGSNSPAERRSTTNAPRVSRRHKIYRPGPDTHDLPAPNLSFDYLFRTPGHEPLSPVFALSTPRLSLPSGEHGPKTKNLRHLRLRYFSLSATRRRFRARRSDPCARALSTSPSSCPSSSVARCSAARARVRYQYPSAASAESARTVTSLSGETSRNPPEIAKNSRGPFSSTTCSSPVVNSATMGACSKSTPKEPSRPGRDHALRPALEDHAIGRNDAERIGRRHSGPLGNLVRTGDHFVNPADHVERLLREDRRSGLRRSP